MKDSWKTYVRSSSTQACNAQQKLEVSRSSSLSGSLTIRAPLTLDSDSDSEINYHESGYITSSSNISVGSVSGEEEFETASERPFVADSGEEALEESGSVELFWPSMSDPDEYEPVGGKVMVGDPNPERVRPIANLSWESDGSDVVDEGIEDAVSKVEGGELLGHVKVLVSEFVEQFSTPPRVKVSEVEEDESMVVEQSSLNSFVKGRNEDSIQMECIEDCSLATAEFSETNSDELNFNVLEGGEKVEYVEEESFVHESFKKLEKLGVEGNENQIMDLTTCSQPNLIQEILYLGNSHISEAEDTAENRDSFKSIAPSCVLGENVTTGLKIKDPIASGKDLVSVGDAGVQFQGNEAKVEVILKEKDSTIEQGQTRGLFVESVAPGIKVFEVEEEEQGVENSELKNIFKGQTGEFIQAEWTEDNGLGGVATKEPDFVEKAKSMAEESIMHCPNSTMSDVDISKSSGALDRGVHSEYDFGVEGSGNQIVDSNTYSQPNPILEIVYLRKRNLSEVSEGDEYVLCCDFLKSITPSSNVTHEHIFGGETKVRNCKIGRRFVGVTVTHLGEDATTGLKIEDQIAIGKGLVLAGSAGAVQCQGDAACGAKLELCLKDFDFPIKQDQTSLGLSIMKWGGGLVLTTDILSQFFVGSSKIAVNVVLDNKRRGKISVRTSNSDKIQIAGLIGILSVAVSVFGFFRSRFSVQNSR